MTERRFTEREMARIFERAASIERKEPDRQRPSDDALLPAGPRGLTLTQLQEIGREVGIRPEHISRAVGELNRPLPPGLEALWGPPRLNRAIRSVDGRLDERGMARLVRVVEERVPAQGTVSEALGAVRWTAHQRHLDRQVSLEPEGEETLIRVEERYSGAIAGIVHGLPAGYGAMFGLTMGLEWVGGTAAGLLGALVLGLVAFALGRLVWSAMARRSGSRTYALAEELADVASRIVGGPDGADEAGEPRPADGAGAVPES
ncbi:MAG: hypothetical protein PVI57_01640 [Gemmatimonadota bacterium]|jgi:hypothetical protein